MKSAWFIYIILIYLFVGSGHNFYAHGDIHEKIERVTQEIIQNPDSADLYFVRGTLYQYHGDFGQAYSDYRQTKSLNPHHTEADLSLATLCLQHNFPDSGMVYIERFLTAQPSHVPGLFTKARLLTLSGNYDLALENFETGMAYATSYEPENFLELAQATLLVEQSSYDEAIKWLEEGLFRLGFVITLEEQIIALHAENGNLDQALVRIDQLLEQMDRKESWLLKKATILISTGRIREANAVCMQAEKAVARLPLSKQNTDAVKELKKEIESLKRQIIKQLADLK